MSAQPTIGWFPATGKDLARDMDLVRPGDLVRFESLPGPEAPPSFRSLVRVAAVTKDSQVGLHGHWANDYLERDGTIERSDSYYSSYYLAGWDRLCVLRGGAPEIFRGERVDEVRTVLDAYAAGALHYAAVLDAFDEAVFAISAPPLQPGEPVDPYDVPPYGARYTFDAVTLPHIALKTLTMQQRAELIKVSHFTNGGGGPCRRERELDKQR